ncbi:MAG: hypothetical protein A2836_01835 [Candidatus Taylorbacteria bacterium RIFCSPHIGHO2_01_FULL_45_63]|uniref:Serine protease n=1 Tax=Candidatus Taylorbacteria bacterium RIFCSPHIGHO2_02_FULL_45_35 TaxID=1802311 RepID=A0A1G2MR40_9BACT|nr:MAG: hypothetical protein A2836_01835 [Candidatus Taylorbacteria bacterium RIFCSPHIGHO2_01_FULL_45_63]OHA26360.1 MAG: hypothetical protein A3D56_03740 [Candidatus Taylorbacteria bacterium RIFCSPHIGHO2_02_FULL_45_35]OHA32804.1 MAG: hypothetical protein A3A22_02595 [Candidatus Taylorbacteria bacterium RIFCSPLOWO2_01_FULL_45_34b]
MILFLRDIAVAFLGLILGLFLVGQTDQGNLPDNSKIEKANISTTTEIRYEIKKQNGVVGKKLETENAADTEKSSKILATSSPAENSAVKAPKIKPIPQTTAEKAVKTPEKLVNQDPDFSFLEMNEKARSIVVNILCTTKDGGLLKPISGTGAIIDTRGVVLTNAHIAQYLLLKDYGGKNSIECILRTGSPAYPRYHVELLFISPAWIKSNAKNIITEEPLGTGEHDYALLRITANVDENTPLPAHFPALPIEIGDGVASVKDQVVIAGYPAGFLGGIAIQRELFVSSALASVQEKYTFGTSTTDILSLGGSILAQKGASGGAVVSKKGDLIGIAVTTSLAENTAERDLRALTVSHINRSLVKELGVNIVDFLSGDIQKTAAEFNTGIAPLLTKQLENAISKGN